MIIEILLGLSVALNIGFIYLLVRASRRLIQFDDLFELLVHDIDTNVKFFAKLLNTPLLENSPEILDAQRNMGIIRERLNEYALRMEELAQRPLRENEKENRR